MDDEAIVLIGSAIGVLSTIIILSLLLYYISTSLGINPFTALF